MIKILKENLEYCKAYNPWVKLYFDEVEFPCGKVGNYNRVIERDGQAGVAVLPLCRDKLCLVRQYRYPIQKEIWEIPRGFSESQNSQSEAIRELFEETGIDADLVKSGNCKIVDLGEVYPNSGLLATKVQIFAVVFDISSEPACSAGKEICEVKWFSKDWIFSQIQSAKIADTFTISAILKAQLKRLI